jgi:CBS domain containing-hemolysin-like protein
MIPISKIFMLDLDTNIDPSLIATIQQYNFSTIAVHHTVKHRILGIVRVKQLLGVDFNAGLRLRDCVKI